MRSLRRISDLSDIRKTGTGLIPTSTLNRAVTIPSLVGAGYSFFVVVWFFSNFSRNMGDAEATSAVS